MERRVRSRDRCNSKHQKRKNNINIYDNKRGILERGKFIIESGETVGDGKE